MRKITQYLFTFTFLLYQFSIQLNAQIDHTKVGIDSTIYMANTIFVPKFSTPSGLENWGVTGADFDNDGDIDFVTCSFKDNKINLHLNNGKGELSEKTSFATCNGPRSITSGDFNQDGKIDVATISMNDGNIYVHFNTGKGFTQNGIYPCGTFCQWITTTDIDGDGNLDLIGVSVNQNHVGLFYGSPKGKFAAGKMIPTGTKPRVAYAADMNNDGKKDIVTACDDGFIYIHYNDEKEYKNIVKLETGNSVWGLQIKDLNKDGYNDIAAASYIGQNLVVFLSLGDSIINQTKKNYDKGTITQSGQGNFDLVLQDFDLDGDFDAVTASTRDGNVNVHLNNGHGKFSEKSSFSSGNWNARILGFDVDGDKDPDIITCSIKDNNLNIHKNIASDPIIIPSMLFGKIQDKITKAPVLGSIYLKNAEGITVAHTKSNAEGRFVVTVPIDITLSLLAENIGYPSYKNEIIVPKTGLFYLIEVENVLGANVFGKVIDAKTLKPLVSTIEIRDANNNLITVVTTDSKGNYKIRVPFHPQVYIINVSSNYYEPQSQSFVMLQSDIKNVELNFKLEKEVLMPVIQGIIYETGTKNIITNVNIKVFDKYDNLIKEVQSDQNGHYSFKLPAAQYKIELMKTPYFFEVNEVEMLASFGANPLKKDFEMDKIQIGKKLVMKYIFFDIDKATIRPESKNDLLRLKQILLDNPTLTIQLSGHTDSDGKDKYNMKLSELRAKAVVNFMLKEYIPIGRMEAIGYGETKPIAPNDTPTNKQKNRRTEILVLKF